MLSFNHEPEINVGILTRRKIDFELHGDFKSYGMKQTFSGRFSAELSGGRIICTSGADRLEITDEIFFEPTDPAFESFLLKDVTIGVKFHWERDEKQRFKGKLKLIIDGDNITAINIIGIEDYLASVISSEMNAKSSLHLLKAHAIISRSWLLAQIEKRKVLKEDKTQYSHTMNTDTEQIKWYDREDHLLFDVCADDHCQRYQGMTKIFTDVVLQAIKQTSGIVLTAGDNICDARYSKSCGGITESFENVWEPIRYKYLSSVFDYKFEPENYNIDFSDENNTVKWIKENPSAFCNTSDKKILAQVLPDFDQETTDFFRWKVEYLQQQLKGLIFEKSGIDFGDILDLIPIERGFSSRLIKLKIVGSKRTLVIGKELEIRRTLSKSHLYSSAFVVEKSDIKDGVPQKFVLYGAGWGHGVGFCQIGGAVMAAKGYQFDEILLHYFNGAKLKKIY